MNIIDIKFSSVRVFFLTLGRKNISRTLYLIKTFICDTNVMLFRSKIYSNRRFLFNSISLLFCLIPLLFFAQEQTIYKLTIQGNTKTKTSFIENITLVKPGQILDSTRLDNDIKQLKRLPNIANAYYQVFYSHENMYNVFYNVEENFTIIPSANIYTSTENNFAYRIGLHEFNLFGRAMVFGGSFQHDNYNSYKINFRAPYLFSRQLGLAFTHNNQTTLEPLYFGSNSANYKYNITSFEVLGLYQLNFTNKFEIGINFFNEDYSYQTGAIPDQAPRALNADKTLYKFVYEFNNLDYNFQNINGFRSTLYAQYVTSKVDNLENFVIAWNDFIYCKTIGKKGNWANRLRLGISSNINSPFAPFSVDNNINIRGVGNTIDRGTASIVLNTEYRYTLFDKNWFILQGNAFIDSGTWRNPGGSFSDFTDSRNLRVYPGLGLRFMHKRIFNAIFRIDYGYGITKNGASGLVFGIGQYF